MIHKKTLIKEKQVYENIGRRIKTVKILKKNIKKCEKCLDVSENFERN